MRDGPFLLWVAVWVIALVDFVWCRALGLGITNWLPFLAAIGSIAAVGLIYRLSGRSLRIAAMANNVLLWMLGSLFGAILTYAAAAQAGPLYDVQLTAADVALGFDWTAWFDFVSANRPLQLPLGLAYSSLLPQILLSTFWFSLSGREHRNTELLTNFIVAVLLTTATFHVFPALGPGLRVPALHELYIDELVKLRRGDLSPLNIMNMKGIVAFPSFHTVLAALFVHAHRGSVLFIPVALLNGLMLVSIPSEGGHYFVDVLAGVAIAGVTIAATSMLARVLARHPIGSMPLIAKAGAAGVMDQLPGCGRVYADDRAVIPQPIDAAGH